MSGAYFGYILAAYAFAAAIVGGLILRAVLDHRAQVRALAALEARGVHRRSRRKRVAADGASEGQTA